MRISDWSSDVCSSELTVRPVRIDQDCHPPSHHVSPRRQAGGGEDSALAHELGSPDKTLAPLLAAVDFLRHAGQTNGFADGPSLARLAGDCDVEVLAYNHLIVVRKDVAYILKKPPHTR